MAPEVFFKKEREVVRKGRKAVKRRGCLHEVDGERKKGLGKAPEKKKGVLQRGGAPRGAARIKKGISIGEAALKKGKSAESGQGRRKTLRIQGGGGGCGQNGVEPYRKNFLGTRNQTSETISPKQRKERWPLKSLLLKTRN